MSHNPYITGYDPNGAPPPGYYGQPMSPYQPSPNVIPVFITTPSPLPCTANNTSPLPFTANNTSPQAQAQAQA